MIENTRRQAGRALIQVLIVLVVLAAAGAWNYHRNWQAEAQNAPPRPFETYATGDLEALRDAYTNEVESFQARYDAKESTRQRASGAGLMDQRVREFEQIQATSDRLRDLRADVAEREARLREVEEELGQRANQVAGLALHLGRLFTI